MSELPRLILITDRRRIAGPGLHAALAEALRAGVRLAVLRERDLDAAALLACAERASRLAEAHGARLLVSDRIDVALLARAAGVQLRASSVPPAAARRLVGPPLLVGASVHSAAEARAASVAGADYVVFGPVFETPEKAPFARIRAAETQGLDALRAAARAARVPLFAVGGVTPERVGECLACGAHGVAAVRGLLGGTSIRANVAGYLRALGGRSSHGTRRARVVRSARRGRAGTGAR